MKRGLVDVPGPLTLRMIERVWSSRNSTRTWVTPPREPVEMLVSLALSGAPNSNRFGALLHRTGSAQDTGDLDELDGLLIHCRTWFDGSGV
jgi:hypothetical protein